MRPDQFAEIDQLPLLSSPTRTLVLGSSGAGKTYFARQLGSLLAVEVIHLDTHFWQPNWVPSSWADWEAKLEQLLAGDSWVMDGNYPKSLVRRLSRSTAVILLDLPRSVCFSRIGKRLVQNWGKSRVELAPGCTEKMDWDFFKWIWNYPRAVRPVILEYLDNLPPEKQIIVLKSVSDISRYLRRIEEQGLINQVKGRPSQHAIR